MTTNAPEKSSEHDSIVKPYISVVLPCLNEEKGLPVCFESILQVANRENLDIEIILFLAQCSLLL